MGALWEEDSSCVGADVQGSHTTPLDNDIRWIEAHVHVKNAPTLEHANLAHAHVLENDDVVGHVDDQIN